MSITGNNTVAEVVVALQLDDSQYKKQLGVLAGTLRHTGKAFGELANILGRTIILPGLGLATTGLYKYMSSGKEGAAQLKTAMSGLKSSFDDFLVRIGTVLNKNGQITKFFENIAKFLDKIGPNTIALIFKTVGLASIVYLFGILGKTILKIAVSVIELTRSLKGLFTIATMSNLFDKVLTWSTIRTKGPSSKGLAPAGALRLTDETALGIAAFDKVKSKFAQLAIGVMSIVGALTLITILFRAVGIAMGEGSSIQDKFTNGMERMAKIWQSLDNAMTNVAAIVVGLTKVMLYVATFRMGKAGDALKELIDSKPYSRFSDMDVQDSKGSGRDFKLGNKFKFSELADVSAKVAAGNETNKLLGQIEKNTRKGMNTTEKRMPTVSYN